MHRLIDFASWAEKHWIALVILLVCCMMLFLSAVMVSWLYGYWSNALTGTKFELGSCWQGIGTVVTGLGGVAGLAGVAWSKYHIDSKYNSPAGMKPPTSVIKPPASEVKV